MDLEVLEVLEVLVVVAVVVVRAVQGGLVVQEAQMLIMVVCLEHLELVASAASEALAVPKALEAVLEQREIEV